MFFFFQTNLESNLQLVLFVLCNFFLKRPWKTGMMERPVHMITNQILDFTLRSVETTGNLITHTCILQIPKLCVVQQSRDLIFHVIMQQIYSIKVDFFSPMPWVLCFLLTRHKLPTHCHKTWLEAQDLGLMSSDEHEQNGIYTFIF